MTKEYARDELAALVADYYDKDAPDASAKINRWLARGDGVAVYRNNDLSHPEAGEPQFVSFGSPGALLEVPQDQLPERLPDFGGRINWRFGLEGIYRGESLPTAPDKSSLSPYELTTEYNNFGIPDESSPERFAFVCARDNHEPWPRKVTRGVIVFYTQHHTPTDDQPFGNDERRAMISDEYGFEGNAIFIMDDGHTVFPMWSGGYTTGEPAPVYPEGSQPKAILYPFPTDQNVHAKTGKPVDYLDWRLGPRRAYHLKIRRQEA